MRSARLLVSFLILALLAGCDTPLMFPSAPAAPAREVVRPAYQPPEDYRLNTGDVISVRVYGGDEDIRVERLRLDHSGMLVLPFGDFKVQGRTTREVERAVTDNVKGRLLKNPRVSVTIDEYRPFFVDGQVGRPGAYPYVPGLTVRKAITIAGGLRERASVKKIYLLPESDKTGAAINVDLNAPVGPGDTINVEESFF